MKNLPISSHSKQEKGYATMAVVASVSLVLISMMTFSLLGNLNSFDSQISAQVKQDYSQKEDAILTSLLHIVPNKAIGAMKQGSASTAESYTWSAIFNEALTLANAEQAASPQLLTSLGLEDSISANSGDTILEAASEIVEAPVATDDGTFNLVNGGNWWEYNMLFHEKFYHSIPAPLMLSHADYLLDKRYPVVSHDKLHVHNYQGYNRIYFKGCHVSTDLYPLYNRLRYPDVKFGYRKPGQLFVAKRNWWTFSLTFGKGDQARTGIPPVTKNYVLSIYEIPSQLPLSGTALLKVGKFADGSDWQNVNLQGGIYGDSLQTDGSVSISSGSISARKSVALNGVTTVDGETLNSNFNDLGQREARALESASDFYGASLAGNVGKVAFIPLNPGIDFLKIGSDGERSERISPTGWKTYTRGANQAAMRLEVTEMVDLSTQLPIEVKLTYIDTSGGEQSIVYRRGLNWPAGIESGGSAFPFQTAELENGKNSLAIYLERIPQFLTSLGNAADLSINHSVVIYPDSTQPTVVEPSIPSADSDLAVSLRSGKDLTSFPKGFSILTDMRLYIAESLNSVATTPPAGSGLPSTEEYYPPLSLFAPEKRFGESLSYSRPVNLRGQVSTLKNSSTDTFNPLDFKGADDSNVSANQLNAELVGISSPAELPPINLMNWMVTIEEVH